MTRFASHLSHNKKHEIDEEDLCELSQGRDEPLQKCGKVQRDQSCHTILHRKDYNNCLHQRASQRHEGAYQVSKEEA